MGSATSQVTLPTVLRIASRSFLAPGACYGRALRVPYGIVRGITATPTSGAIATTRNRAR